MKFYKIVFSHKASQGEPNEDHEHDFLIIEAEDIAELNRLIGNKTISRVLGLDTEEFNKPGVGLKIGVKSEDEIHAKLIEPISP